MTYADHLKDVQGIASQAIDNLAYRFSSDDVLDAVCRALTADQLADIALFLTKTFDDRAELNDEEYAALREYCDVHGL